MNKRMMIQSLMAALVAVFGLAGRASAAAVTGNPAADAGWTLAGHSLENGIYVTGSANYGFNAYGAGFTITSGSNLEISDGTYSWLAGDTVLGVGGAVGCRRADAPST